MTTIRFKLRRGQAAQWTTDNPVLAAGEPGLEIDTGKFKVGDGFTVWSSLPYFVNATQTAALIQAAIDGAELEGVPGPQGPQGIPGTNGTNGTNGSNGTDGIDGTNGADGNSVTVTLVPAASWPPASDSNPLHLYFRVP